MPSASDRERIMMAQKKRGVKVRAEFLGRVWDRFVSGGVGAVCVADRPLMIHDGQSSSIILGTLLSVFSLF